jgi:hypothetical protein
MESKSNTDILKGYFFRKQGSLDTMTCRACKKDIKAPKSKIKMLIVELGMGVCTAAVGVVKVVN